MPYKDVTSHGDIVVAGKFEYGLCSVESYLWVLVIARCRKCKACLLVEDAVRLEFVACCKAVEVLVDKCFSRLWCKFGNSSCSAELEHVTINIFE